MGRRRVAIAAVVGMLFMALVFLIAMGAEVYISNAEEATRAAQSQAQQRAVIRGQEVLAFGGLATNVEITNTGPVTMTVVAMLLKFENGTVFDLNGTSSPQFTAVVVPAGEAILLQSLVPKGACEQDGPSCLEDYEAIVHGMVAGRAVGLVTSLGNTFWYVPTSTLEGNPDPNVFRTPSVELTSAANYTGISGLSFSGGGDSFYQVQVQIGFWQGGPSPNADMFAIGVSNGSSFMFCGGLDWSSPTGSTNDQAPGNSCSSTPLVSLGSTWSAANSCNTQQLACEFVGTAYVYFGQDGGTFRMEFEGVPSGDANVLEDSVIVATQLQ